MNTHKNERKVIIIATYLIPDKTDILFNVPIKQYIIIDHNTNKISMPTKRTKKLLGITIHNTDWINVNSATTPAEQYTRACINGNLGTVRVHYYVDNKCIWQNLPDDWQSWHAADGNGNGNTATISIECIMRNSYDTDSLKSMDNCARLTAYLCKKYSLTVDDIYTHTYWLHIRDNDSVSKCGDKDKICTTKHSYKTCPAYIIPQWDKFLELVVKYYSGAKSKKANTSTVSTSTAATSSTTLPYKIKVKDSYLNVRKGAGLNNPVLLTIKKGEVYTIVEEKQVKNSDGSVAVWGLLKAYQKTRNAWINVGDKYVTKIK